MKKFDFDDILIVPKTTTDIESRYLDINLYKGNLNFKLPLFNAPMDTVVDVNNYEKFSNTKINVVIPRNDESLTLINGKTFKSYSIGDFVVTYLMDDVKNKKDYVLIDVANGHMTSILKLCKEAKKDNPDMIIMAGNIANPETYREYVKSNVVDYVRVGIGNGNGCLTTQQLGVGYPNASLINECYKIKQELINSGECPNPTKIVADGGMKGYSDIIKALALGADYVMIGSILNKALESAGQDYLYGFKISRKLAKKLFNKGFPVKKQFYGMSTKIAQKKFGNDNLKTSEGVVRYRKVEYTLYTWLSNFDHYLRSAMSYSNAKTLDEFIGKADFIHITNNALNRFKK